jgi:imidazolonepropionase-like amidohydrolase
VSEGWRVAREIAAAGVPSSIIVIDAPGGKLEAVDLSLGTGQALREAGATFGFHTDDGITDSRWFLRSAALAVRAGLDREAALRAMTINGARMMELDARVGSLEVGKDADLVILSGDPFGIRTRVEQTWVEGVKVFDLSDPRDRLWAEGGYDSIRDGIYQVHVDMEDHD